ncbi:MAG TPA: hypothetical protein VIH90_04550 [Candidatus Saccharimonadales bacterium]
MGELISHEEMIEENIIPPKHEVFGFKGDVVPDVNFADSTFDAVVQFNQEEFLRRYSHGLGAINDLTALDTLSLLPHDLPIPRRVLSEETNAAIDIFPNGLVSVDAETVARLWNPVLRLSGILSTTEDIEDSIENVGAFPDDSRRGVIVMGERPDSAQLQRASKFGIGVAHANNDSSSLELLLPAEATVVRLGPIYWWLLEAIFDRWIETIT